MKKLRKWSRILHRDIGFFFLGTTLIYGISGIALNHMKDWDPNYVVDIEKSTTQIDFSKESINKEKILNLLIEFDAEDLYKTYNYVEDDEVLKIYLKGRSSVTVWTSSGEVYVEFVRKRPVFYQSNYLHYNPNRWWTWFSDAFAGAMILFAITAIFMVRGRKGPLGRGGIYIILGIIIPILFLIFMT
jgi:hypothetical protein